MAITYGGAGSRSIVEASATSPGLPSGLAVGDLMLLDDRVVHHAGVANQPGTPTGWTLIGSVVVEGNSGETRLTWWWRRYQAGDSVPTVSWSASTTGAKHYSRIHRIVGAVLSGDPVAVLGTAARTPSSTTQLGPIPGVAAPAGSMVLVAATRPEDFGTDGATNSFSTLTGDGLSWVEVEDIASAPADDLVAALDYAVATTATTITSKTFTTLSGTSSVGLGRMLVIAGAALGQTVTVTAGIPSAEVVGTPSVVPGTATVAPAGIGSAETVGTPTLLAGPVTVSPAGIPSAEAVGVPRVDMRITLTGIASGEAVGVPTVVVGDTLVLTGIASAEVVGTPTVVPGPVTVSQVGAIASAEAVGTPMVVLVVQVGGVPSAEAVGTPALVPGPVELAPAGIPSAEAVGTPEVVVGSVALTLTGIPSGETVGVPRIRMTLSAVGGIASAEQVGVPTLLPGGVTLYLAGIASAEAVGVPELTVTLDPTARFTVPRQRTTPIYELLVVARIPALSGPPTFLEVDALEWSSLTWSSTLSRPQELTANCLASSVSEVVAQRLRAPDRLPTELWLLRNSVQVFAGPLASGSRRGDTLTLNASGLLAYAASWIVMNDLRFDQVDQFTIAATLIDQWQALEYGHFGIDTSAVGTSGILRDGSYVRDEIHFVGKRIEELGARRDGFDVEVDPTTRRLELWYPGKGVDRSTGEDAIVFDGRNIDSEDALFSIAPGDLASEAFGTGSSTGGEATLWAAAANPDLRAAYGRTAATGTWSDVSEQPTLDAHVGALLDARDQPLRAPGQRVKVSADADLTAYAEGDTVFYELDKLLGVGGAYRIRSRKVAVDSTGTEAVDLEFV